MAEDKKFVWSKENPEGVYEDYTEEEKKQRELLAKQKEEEIRRITENDLLVLRDQLSFQMVGNKNETLYGALYGKNNPINYSDKDLIEFKSIEAKINNILLNFDLDKRIDITKKIINNSKNYKKVTKNVNKKQTDLIDICAIIKKCSIDEISEYLLEQGNKKDFPDITKRQ